MGENNGALADVAAAAGYGAGRAGNDYERKRIQEGIEALRRVFN